MSVEEEIESLQRRLDELAHHPDDQLVKRYELRRPPMPPGLYWRLRWLAGWILRWLKSARVWRPEPWPVSLRHAEKAKAKPLLIWAVGADRDALRAACEGFAKLKRCRGFAPVLVTDVADFALFSRLGWLVEYLPWLDGKGETYGQRKMRFLARLYHRVPALPLRAGLEINSRADSIQRWLSAR